MSASASVEVPQEQVQTLHQAVGVLTLAYSSPPDEALRRLVDAAHRNSVELAELAQVVVSVASGCPPPTKFCDLVDREWGDLLF